MKFNSILYIFLISPVLLTTVDLEKYNKINTVLPVVVFDSSDFKIDEEIYIVISGYFIFDYIEYVFVDDIPLYSNYPTSGLRKGYSTKTETTKDSNGVYKYQVRYYTIEKTKNNINNRQGKYLLIFAYMDGEYVIENTKENKGNSKSVIIGVVVAVVVVLIIVGLIIYFYRKRKYALRNQAYNQAYNENNQVQVNNNVIPYNNNVNSNNEFNSNEKIYNNSPNYNYQNNNTPNYNYQNNNTPNNNYQNNNVPNNNYPNM